MSKYFRINPFNLETCLVFDHAPRHETGRPLGADSRLEEEAWLREYGLGAAKDLREADRSGSENDSVAAGDDPDVRFPTLSRDAAVDPGRKPVGMQGAIENLKREVGDADAARMDSHHQDLFSRMERVDQELLPGSLFIPGQ
jgi:hypothetical protein